MNALVLQSDFGLKERFVASMKGVAAGIDPHLPIHDLTHQISPYNIWEAAHTLAFTIQYWPEQTVFVSVVDPGVGTERRSIVAHTVSGHFIVTPDNGTLTLVNDVIGIREIRVIDESVHRRPGSESSHTFHGRDVYAYTGAKLAAGKIRFEEIGTLHEGELIRIPYTSARTDEKGVTGTIVRVEEPYGNIVTNIPSEMLIPEPGNEYLVRISRQNATEFERRIRFVSTFGDLEQGEVLLYEDSVQYYGLAINRGNFAGTFGIGEGPEWTIAIK